MAIEVRAKSMTSTSEKIQEEIQLLIQIQRFAVYTLHSESSDLVVEYEGHTANAIQLGRQVPLCTSLIHALRAYIFHCWGHH